MPYITTAERIGIKKGRKETAKNLLSLGVLTEEQNPQVAELSNDEVRQLKTEAEDSLVATIRTIKKPLGLRDAVGKWQDFDEIADAIDDAMRARRSEESGRDLSFLYESCVELPKNDLLRSSFKK